MALIRIANRNMLQRSLVLRLSRSIKTSQKKDDTAVVVGPTTKEEFANPSPKNWVSYGFDYKDETNDRNTTKMSFFSAVTLCLVWGTFLWSYSPDPQLRDWAQREGFLELRRREQSGVDLVNPNYVDPASINLPSDEDLSGVEIII